VDDLDAGIQALKDKIRSWGGATSTQELGISRARLKEVAHNACIAGDVGTIKKLKEADVLEILRLAAL